MTIFEFAKKMEKDGEHFYRMLSFGCKKTGLQKILSELADAELDHYHVLEEMEQGKLPMLADSALLTNAKNIFAVIDKKDIDYDAASPEIDLFKQARDIEIKSQNFYEQKTEESNDNFHRELFKKIAEQEHQHYILMENMIEFLQRPHTWLENAEWHHLDEY